MTKVTTSRSRLNRELGKRKHTVLLIDGTADPLADDIHTTAETVEQPWRKTFLIKKPKASERTAWFKGGAGYAVWSGRRKKVATKGKLAELLLTDGVTPSILAIRSAFVVGDKA